MKLGLSGYLAKGFIRSPLTPLLLLAALGLGLIALLTIPREEEPQISVPMIDIMVRADGLAAADAVELITEPLEAIISGISEVEHTYSNTMDDQVLVTARFKVGVAEDLAVLRVHEEIRGHYDQLPLGVPEPLIIARGINDVPILTLTLSPEPGFGERWTDASLLTLAEELQSRLTAVEGSGLSFIVGGRADQVRIEPDPERLSLYGVTLQQLAGKIAAANSAFPVRPVFRDGAVAQTLVGETLRDPASIGLLLLTTRDGRPVYVRDVADVVIGAQPSDHRVWSLSREGEAHAEDSHGATGDWTRAPAVTLALAKRPGANAVVVAEHVLETVESLRGTLIPDGVRVDVTRNYGETAAEKANELFFHLGLATVSIVVLIALMVGWRESIVVLVVIPTTILLTLFASNTLGFTINRVSLFALIFSIGILVDDAIVVIENIARHWAMKDGRSKIDSAVQAVAEVGNPTIVATLTVVAALLPMLFVSGLMGPYMAPIPINASAAMIFSFFVAMVITPWLMVKIAGNAGEHGHGAEDSETRLGRGYRAIAGWVVKSRARAWTFLIGAGVMTLVIMMMIPAGLVTVKLLPFDNKSEFQVIVDLPEGASLEDTERVLFEAADVLSGVEEVISIQAYAGTSAPFNFNGLVRHYFYRTNPEQGDLQVNLASRHHRSRQSHDIALEARALLSDIPMPAGTVIKVAETPPGPPVLATLLAEIYGPDGETRRAVAAEVRRIFEEVDYIVDVDDSFGAPRPRLQIVLDQDNLEFYGVEQGDVFDTLRILLDGRAVGYAQQGDGRNPLEITLDLPRSDRVWTERLLSTPVPANLLPGDRTIVELGDVVSVREVEGSPVIYRRNGRFADMVMGELAGRYEAPIYGMGAVADLIESESWPDGLPRPDIRLFGQPVSDDTPTLLWDGEWEITYVTFRDMGAAFMVALAGIYVLVVAQFGSCRAPLVILTPVPLTLIGILIGHALFGAPFSATSMIGFIALAGIIVRNSILLVDFIRHEAQPDETLRETVLRAGAIRFKPILLTALAAMLGASVILFDPIFQGLAISLLFGLLSSTLLTLLVIPAVYVVFKDPDTPYRGDVKKPHA